MKRNLAVIATVVLLVIFGWSNHARGSWVIFSTEEVIRQSDVILIGEIIGPVDMSQGLNGTWTTYWKVKVDYYLKGDQSVQELIVTTPGAENKTVWTSNDYRLDQWGKTVLLMLKQREGRFEPFSPQGVIALQKSGVTSNLGQQIDRKSILKEFTIINPQGNEPKILEEYISGNSPTVISKQGNAGSNLSRPISDNISLLVVGEISLVLIIIGIWLIMKRSNKRL